MITYDKRTQCKEGLLIDVLILVFVLKRYLDILDNRDPLVQIISNCTDAVFNFYSFILF